MKKSIILLIIVILMISIVSCNQKPVQDELGVIDIEPDNTDKETETPPTDTNIEKTEKPTEQPSTEKEEVTNIKEPQPENKTESEKETESENEEVKTETESDKQEELKESEDSYRITYTSHVTVPMQELIECSHVVAECDFLGYDRVIRVKSASGQFQNYTDIKMKVNKVYRGQIDEKEITVRLTGGNIGGVDENSNDSPLFSKSKKYIMFLYIPDLYSSEFNTKENYYRMASTKHGAFVYDENVSETEEYYNISSYTKNPDLYTIFNGEEHLKEYADKVIISKETFEQVMADVNELIPITDFYKNQALQRIENDYKDGKLSKSEYEAKISKDQQYAEIIEQV